MNVADLFNRIAYSHLVDCECEPCEVIRRIRRVPTRMLWKHAGQCTREHTDDNHED